MTNILLSMAPLSKVVFLLEVDANLADKTRILGFDQQTLIQVVFQGVAVILLFTLLGKLLFNPVREILRKRAEEIEGNFKRIDVESKEVEALKKDYDSRIKNIKLEADKILSHAHTKAVAREDEIVKDAHEEANKIMQRAHLEIVREREQMKDDIRREIIDVATIMASKFIEASLNEEQHRALISETMSEMGDKTWLN